MNQISILNTPLNDSDAVPLAKGAFAEYVGDPFKADLATSDFLM